VYRKNPFRELWEHAHRQYKFEPQEAGQVVEEDTPMVDAEDQA